MTIIGIGLIVLATVWSVHFVYMKAHKHGHEAGVSIGRQQILEENIRRTELMRTSFDEDLKKTSELLTGEEPSKIKYEGRC